MPQQGQNHGDNMSESDSKNSRETVFALMQAALIIERRLDRVLANARGVSFTEYRMLSELAAAGGSLTRVDLAAAVQLTPSAVTRALKPLEKMGYVTTRKGARDARQSLAVVTDAGDVLLCEARVLVDEVIAELPVATLPAAAIGRFGTEILQYR